MTFDQEEKLAIINMCYELIHADGKVLKGELIALHQIKYAIDFDLDYVPTPQDLSKKKTLITLNRMSLEKKQAFSKILNDLAVSDNHLHLKEIILLADTFDRIRIGKEVE